MTAASHRHSGNHASDCFMTLADGRRLGYQLLGDQYGSPLFFFHGTPGSRLCLTSDDPLANIPGLQLILPERPGYGLSCQQPDRRINDWANDVLELADQLRLGTFAVSGGHFIDAMLIQADWQIDVSQITQPVHIWHGIRDNLSPIQNIRRLADLIPQTNCELRYLPEAGHFLIDLPEVIQDIQRLVEEGALGNFRDSP